MIGIVNFSILSYSSVAILCYTLLSSCNIFCRVRKTMGVLSFWYCWLCSVLFVSHGGFVSMVLCYGGMCLSI